jgi:clathrin heavy chain
MMVRSLGRVKDKRLDNTLLLTYAKLNRNTEFESLLSETLNADLKVVGDKLLEFGNFQEAKLVFVKTNNSAKLAICLVHLNEFGAAMEFAKKANSPKIWVELYKACIAAKDFTKAQVSAMNVIIHPEYLEELINF